MKKSILSLTLLLVVATVTNAAPRFGLIAEQTKGAGVFVTDDMYNAQLTVGSASADASGTTDDATKVSLGANYKVALDSVTALTAGLTYESISGDFDENNEAIDGETKIAVSVGFERALSSNLVLTTQADLYSSATKEDYGGLSGNDVDVTRIFSNGRVGVAYLF